MAIASGEMQPVTYQPDDSRCFGPQFGANSLKLFFTCQTREQHAIFRYGLDGVQPLDFGVPNAGNPAPGPGDGMITFNDGSVLYIANDDGSNAQPYAYLNGTTSARFKWSRNNASRNWLINIVEETS